MVRLKSFISKGSSHSGVVMFIPTHRLMEENYSPSVTRTVAEEGRKFSNRIKVTQATTEQIKLSLFYISGRE